MVATRQELKAATSGIVKYLDRTYGWGNWASNDEVESDPRLIEFRKLWNSDTKKKYAKKKRIPFDQLPAFANMTIQQKNNYIKEQIEQGKKPAEIADALGYAGTQPIYNVIKKLNLNYHKIKYRIDANLSEDIVREVSKVSIGYQYMTGILWRDYGIDVDRRFLQRFMRKHKMYQEIEDMRKRREKRYLIKDGKTTAFFNLAELARYVGMSKATALKQKNNDHPKFKILTWEQRFNGEGN